jgi:hypothetical protein
VKQGNKREGRVRSTLRRRGNMFSAVATSGMLRLTLGEYRLDRLSSGGQTGRVCRKSAAVIARQTCWQREQAHGCNRRELLVSSQWLCQPLGTDVATVCRLPHAKAITGHNRPKLQNAGKIGALFWGAKPPCDHSRSGSKNAVAVVKSAIPAPAAGPLPFE